jgi:hypothetical protein
VRRTLTWLLVGAVAALGVAAGIDALPGDDDGTLTGPGPTATGPIEAGAADRAVSQLREAGVTGVLTYSDGDCRLHALTLPDLEPAHAPPVEMCTPFTARGGISAFAGDVVWSGLGYQTVQVVLSQEELTAALERRGVPGRYRARQAVALARGRYAVLAQDPTARLVGIFADGRLSGLAALGLEREAVLRPSPAGRFVAVLARGGIGVHVADLVGRGVTLPDVSHPHAIAWSPDERWTVLATASELYIFPTGRTGGPLVRIPLAVRDLAWEDAE